jgi:putative restriction endonuclease
VRPDHRIEVRSDLLEEVDGPTLVGIQSLHGRQIELPRRSADRPSEERLARRFEEFLEQDRRAS